MILEKEQRQRLRRCKKYLIKPYKNQRAKQTELNNTITELKTTLEGINSRITEAEEWISDLEDRTVEITAMEQNKEKQLKAPKTT